MADDFIALEQMVYSGRGIIVGATPAGNPFVAYSITGRSPPSQARRLVYDPETHVIKIGITDEKVLAEGNPALLVYPAVMRFKSGIVASNGAQTMLLHDAAQLTQPDPERIIRKAFAQPHFVQDGDKQIDLTTFEPDDPNYTPRISACVTDKQGSLHIVKRSETSEKFTSTYSFDLHKGKGLGITTYKGGNEKPLLPFDSDLLEVRLESEQPADLAQSMYTALRGKGPEDYRVAVAVMMIDLASGKVVTGRVNRHGDGK